MDRNPLSLWSKHLISAAIDYFNERGTKACIIVDNTVLKDGVLTSLNQDGGSDFIVCVAPGFTTQLDFGETDLTIAVKFDNYAHVMTIPYHAIKAIIAADSGGILTEDGQINLISVPPVVLPPGSRYRNRPEFVYATGAVVDDSMQTQPVQDEMQLVARKRS